MSGAEAILILFLALLLTGAVLAGLAARAARRRLRAGWRLNERSTRSGEISVGLRRTGQARIEIARIPCGLESTAFSERLAEARAEAEDRAVMLNAGLPRGRSRRRLGR